MSGLDKIIADILAEGDKRYADILAQAEAEAAELRAESDAKAAKESERLLKQARDNANHVDELAVSSGNQAMRRERLASKIKIIDSVIGEAVETVLAYDDVRYFDAVKKVVLKNAAPKKGVLRLNTNDLARVPSGFLDDLNGALGAERALTLDDKTADIRGGAIIIYGEIEENCSFDAIAASMKDELRDKVAGLLFE